MNESERCLALINSRLERLDETEEHLPDAAAAGHWLAQCFDDISPEPLDDATFSALRRLRTGVRELALARISGAEPDRAALDHLNDMAGRVARTERLAEDWSRQSDYRALGRSNRPAAARLGILAAEAIGLLSSDVDLAECAADNCVVIFLRTDPRRRWHDERCGNRVRAARSHARRRHTVQHSAGTPAD